MDKHTATTVFESLSSGVRLDVFRLLVKKGLDGMVAGEIASTLDVPPTNLSFHLKAMTHAGMVTVTQEGRYQRYRANLALMMDLIAYLTEECCSGQEKFIPHTVCSDLPTRSLTEAEMKTLPIIWQRLVSSAGTTCPRCHATGSEVQRAFERLKYALEPLGVEPTLEVRELDQSSFESSPRESNRIWIAGKPMEDWLEGKVGSSQCCNECGDNECRTVEVGGETYEVIPEQLLVRAGLIAATSMLDPTNPDKFPENP